MSLAPIRSPMTQFERDIRALQYSLEDAMDKPGYDVPGDDGRTCRERLVLSIAELEQLILAHVQHENELGYSCWSVRASEGSLIDWTLQGIGLCRELEAGGSVALRSVAHWIEPCEPGLAEVARSLAEQGDTAVELYEEVAPDALTVWANTPQWVKLLGLGLGALFLINAANLVRK